MLQLRRFPHPYRAMLAICSDLDETPEASVYRDQMRFLNTRAATAVGPGVGLEVGNTIYFDMPRDQFAYWNTDDAGRAMVRTLIASGHVDALHSFGDLASGREYAQRAWQELERHGLSLKVWIDHAVAPTNFGADIMHGHGDEPRHPAYHADLTLRHVRYVWRGRVTSVIGQDVPSNLGGLRGNTLLKELAKQVLGRAGNTKYRFHAKNRVLGTAKLRDGQTTVEFLRCNPHPAGLDTGDTGAGIGEVLTPQFLDQLIAREGVCLLYTHLGKLNGRTFDESAVRAFQLLARYVAEGKVLVTTTRRLLDYVRLTESVSQAAEQIDSAVLHLTGEPWCGAAERQGLTIYTSSPVREVRWNGEPVAVQQNPSDQTGRPSVSIAWQPLQFPAL